MNKDTIAVIVYNGISPFHLSVPFAVFGEDRSRIGVERFAVFPCAFEKGVLTTSGGFSLAGISGLRKMEAAGVVIVPGWRDPQELPPPALLEALRRAQSRGALLVGLCLGSYVLAAAGLLAGRPATTHWAWNEDLAGRYPTVKVKRDVLYVDDGEIITSAGVAAGLDCCLHLLRRLRGAEIASRVARWLVVPPHRQGGQAQYIEPLRETSVVDHFAKVMAWMQGHPQESHSLDALAARAGMSRRTFTRRFRQAVGTTVGAWLLDQRLALAQRLLETTGLNVDLIAQQVGFGSEVALRKQFNKRLQTTPSRYRKEFRAI